MVKRLVAAATVIIVVLGAGWAWALVHVGSSLGDVRLVDTAGRVHSLRELVKGKVGVVVYWSVSCGHCARQLPGILNLLDRWKGNKGLVVVSVSADVPDMAPAIEAYARSHGLSVPVLVDASPSAPDAPPPLAEALDIVATPAVAVVDCKGKIAFVEELEIDLKALARAVRKSMISCSGH